MAIGDVERRASTRPLSVWVTRSAPGASETAERLSALGFQPLIEPVLTFRPLAMALALTEGDALAFTSTAGVRHAARLTERRDDLVFAVGDATALAARDAGFVRVMSAQGDVDALAKLILSEKLSGTVVHASAQETAGDLVGQLALAGVSCRKTAVYETSVLTTLPHPVELALQNGELKAVLVHSPKAAQAAARMLKDSRTALTLVVAAGLSQACVQPLLKSGFERLLAAARPTDDSLLDVLAELREAGLDG